MFQSYSKFNFISNVFLSLVLSVNFLGSKIVHVGGLDFSVGLLIFPFLAIITDSVTEVYGREKSRQITWVTLFLQTVISIIAIIAVNLPAASRYTTNTEYSLIFGSSIRIIFASLLAFVLSDLLDIKVFIHIKKWTQNKFLWLRSGVSTMLSEVVDTLVFMTLAFHTLPFSIDFLGIKAGAGYDFLFILKIAIPYYLLKITFSWLGTPFIYALVTWLKKDLKPEI